MHVSFPLRRTFLLLFILTAAPGTALLYGHIPFQPRLVVTVAPYRDFTVRTAMTVVPFRDSSIAWTADINFLTISRANGRNRYSSNLLLLGTGIALFGDHPPDFLSSIVVLPFIVPNIGIQYPLLTDRWFVYGKFNTDLYLFYDESRITSECALGSLFLVDNVVIGADVRFPLVRGYRHDRSPYLTITLGAQ